MKRKALVVPSTSYILGQSFLIRNIYSRLSFSPATKMPICRVDGALNAFKEVSAGCILLRYTSCLQIGRLIAKVNARKLVPKNTKTLSSDNSELKCKCFPLGLRINAIEKLMPHISLCIKAVRRRVYSGSAASDHGHSSPNNPPTLPQTQSIPQEHILFLSSRIHYPL